MSDKSDRWNFERVIFLVTEQCTASKFLMQFVDDFHRVFVCGMEILFAGGVLDLQLLTIVAVESVECVGIIDNDIEQRAAVLRQLLLILYCAAQYLDQQAQLVVLLRCNSLIDSVALQEVLFQNLISPDTECRGVFGVDAIPD